MYEQRDFFVILALQGLWHRIFSKFIVCFFDKNLVGGLIFYIFAP